MRGIAGAGTSTHARQREQLVEARRAGRDVVVDYSFWSRAQRDDYRIEADAVTGYLAGFEAPAPDETDVVVVQARHDGQPPSRGSSP